MARILIAEDDDSMRHFLARALERAGHEVVAVGHGADALPVIAEGRFDLLLADIVMPEMDGIELAQRAAEADRNIRVIFITGFAAVALNRSGSDRAHAKVLSKPFHLRELVSEVDRTLAARATESIRPL
jgi:two-component system cell cycle response regulator CpdR